jgi:hypothetical protein
VVLVSPKVPHIMPGFIIDNYGTDTARLFAIIDFISKTE